MMRSGLKISLFFGLMLMFSCESQQKESELLEASYFHDSMKQLTDIIVHDIFSPPVASRNYVYPSIAAYECVAAGNPAYKSLQGQVSGLNNVPQPTNESINYQIAATQAFLQLSKEVVFSVDELQTYQDSLLQDIKKNTPKKVYKESITYGNQMAAHIKDWMKEDIYLQSRSFPKFSVNYDEEWRWQPTPPSYMEGIEPHWNEIRTLVIDSASQFSPVGHPAFSLDKEADFYKELVEVYEIRNQMQAGSEEEQVAQFWDCNPYVSVQKGHFMYALKKITPGGHWVNIVRVASEKNDAEFDQSVHAYTATTIALFDGFISCWDAKYKTSLIRPETLINKYIDENWLPVLQTPPFPEYTSGHSVISTAAAIALTDVYGENFAFDDTTEEEFGLPMRSFSSFKDAAEEAAISRLYGGIHYRSAIDHGVEQGKELGEYVTNELQFLEESQPVVAEK